MSALPTAPEGITAAWLDSVLKHDVFGVQLERVIPGSTTKVFVRAELGDGSMLPLFVKGVFDEPRLPVRVMASARRARILENERACARQSKKFGAETLSRLPAIDVLVS